MVNKMAQTAVRQEQRSRREVQAERALLDAKDSFRDRQSVTTWRLIDEARRIAPDVSERLLFRALLYLERHGIIRRVKREIAPASGKRT